MAGKKKSVKKVGKKGKSVKKNVSDLMIHFMPYSEIVREDIVGKIKKIMGLVLVHKIIILQGKLSSEEEARLIENSMVMVGNIKNFQGIEIAAISGENEHRGLFDKVRRNIAKILVGEQDAITIIGPASVVKEITRNPKKLELMLQKR